MSNLHTAIIAERDRRIVEGEDRDPVCVLADQLEAGQSIADDVIALIWEAHHQGPWRIRNGTELKVFREYCKLSGTPLQTKVPSEVVCRISVYREDVGDCVFTESASGESFAVWTRKGRIYIGFEFSSMAERFRAIRHEYSLEATGNRHLAMVVLEGWDDQSHLYQVCCDLIAAKSGNDC